MAARQRRKCTICCIGGGISGLKAVNDLAEHIKSCQNVNDEFSSSKPIILLEASDRLGGRILFKPWKVINTTTSTDDDIQEVVIKIDVGAAYLHGIDQSNSEFIEFLHNQCGVRFTNKMTAASTLSIHKESVHPLISQNCKFSTIPIYYQKYHKFYDLNDTQNIPSFIPQIDDQFEKLMDDIQCDSDNEHEIASR